MNHTLQIRRPDDWHLHVRDGAMLRAVVPRSSAHFGRAIIMPNLVPPVVTTALAQAYRQRILAAVPAGDDFQPLMTLYLTEDSDPDDIANGARDGLIAAVKLYRERHGTGLKESKQAVEAIGSRHGISGPGGSGCLGVLVLLAVLTASVTVVLAAMTF